MFNCVRFLSSTRVGTFIYKIFSHSFIHKSVKQLELCARRSLRTISWSSRILLNHELLITANINVHAKHYPVLGRNSKGPRVNKRNLFDKRNNQKESWKERKITSASPPSAQPNAKNTHIKPSSTNPLHHLLYRWQSGPHRDLPLLQAYEPSRNKMPNPRLPRDSRECHWYAIRSAPRRIQPRHQGCSDSPLPK